MTMIKTLKQAIEVQQRRVDAGKSGIAPAVRRWAKRNDSNLSLVEYWVKVPEVKAKEVAAS